MSSLQVSTESSVVSAKQQPLYEQIWNGGAIVEVKVPKRFGVGIVAHRVEILDQIGDTLDQWGVSHGFIAPGRGPGDRRFKSGRSDCFDGM